MDQGELKSQLAKVTEERDSALELLWATQRALEAAQAALKAEQDSHDRTITRYAPRRIPADAL